MCLRENIRGCIRGIEGVLLCCVIVTMSVMGSKSPGTCVKVC